MKCDEIDSVVIKIFFLNFSKIGRDHKEQRKKDSLNTNDM